MQSNIETIRKEAHGGPQDSDAAFARRTACDQHCGLPAMFLRHTKFPDVYHRSHHHTAPHRFAADIGATWLADGGQNSTNVLDQSCVLTKIAIKAKRSMGRA